MPVLIGQEPVSELLAVTDDAVNLGASTLTMKSLIIQALPDGVY